MRRNPFDALSIFAIGLALIPALWIPYPLSLVLSSDQKGILAAAIFGIALIAGGIALFNTAEWPRLAFPPVALAAALFAVLACVSAVINRISFTQFFGFGFSVGTGGSIILFAAVVAFGSLMSAERMRKHYLVFVWCLFALAAVIPLFMLWPPAFSIYPLEWPYQPFLLIPGLLMLIALADGSTGRSKRILVIGAIAMGLLFALFSQPVAALVGAALLTLYVLLRIFLLRSGASVPWLAIATAVLLAALYMSGAKTVIPVIDELRLSAANTMSVVKEVSASGATWLLVGSGPDTFPADWELVRPISFNQADRVKPVYISGDGFVREGYSTLLTWTATLGFVGVASFALCFAVLIWNMGGALRRKEYTVMLDPLFCAAALVSLFGFAAALLYSLNPILFYLCALSLGFAGGRLHSVMNVSVNRGERFRWIVAIPFVAVGVAVLVISVAQLSARSLNTHGTESGVNGSMAKALDQTQRAAVLWPLSAYDHDAAFMMVAGGESDITMAGLAIAQNGRDYTAWIAEGSALLSSLQPGATSTIRQIQSVYAEAALLAPSRPAVPLAQAALSRIVGRESDEMRFLQHALELDPTNTAAQAELMRISGQSATPDEH